MHVVILSSHSTIILNVDTKRIKISKKFAFDEFCHGMPLRDASLPCTTVSVRGLLREGAKQKSEKSTQKRDTKVAGREADR